MTPKAEGGCSIILRDENSYYKVYTRFDVIGEERIRIPISRDEIRNIIDDSIINELKEKNLDCFDKGSFLGEFELSCDDGGVGKSAAAYIKISWFEGYQSLHDRKKLFSFWNDHIVELHDRFTILINLAEKLKQIHENGITHRDLNAGNVLINDDNDVILIDFWVMDLSLQVFGNNLWTKPSMIPEWYCPEFLNGIRAGGLPHELSSKVFCDYDKYSFAQMIIFLLFGYYYDYRIPDEKNSFQLNVDSLGACFDTLRLSNKMSNRDTIRTKLKSLYISVVKKELMDWNRIIDELKKIRNLTLVESVLETKKNDLNILRENLKDHRDDPDKIDKLVRTYRQKVFVGLTSEDDSRNSRTIIPIQRKLSRDVFFLDSRDAKLDQKWEKQLLDNIAVFPEGMRKADCLFKEDNQIGFKESHYDKITFRRQYTLCGDHCYEFLKSLSKGKETYDVLSSVRNSVGLTQKNGKETVFYTDSDPVLKIVTPEKMTDLEMNSVNYVSLNDIRQFNRRTSPLEIAKLLPSEGLAIKGVRFYDVTGKEDDSTPFVYDPEKLQIGLNNRAACIDTGEICLTLLLNMKISAEFNGIEDSYEIKSSAFNIYKDTLHYALAIDIANTANVVAFSDRFLESDRTMLLPINETNKDIYKKSFSVTGINSDSFVFVESDANYLSSLTAVQKNLSIEQFALSETVLMGIPRQIYIDMIKYVILPPFKLIVGEDLTNFEKWRGNDTHIVNINENKIREITDRGIDYFKRVIIITLQKELINRIRNHNSIFLEDQKSFVDLPLFVNRLIVSVPVNYGDNKKDIIRNKLSEITYGDILAEMTLSRDIFNDSMRDSFNFSEKDNPANGSYKNVRSYIEKNRESESEGARRFVRDLEAMMERKCFAGQVKFLDEPEAILNYYLNTIQENSFPDKMLIFDLGGGTIDCLLLKRIDGTRQYKIIKQYSNYYGGDVLDVMFVEWLLGLDKEESLIDYLRSDKMKAIMFPEIFQLIFDFKSEYKINPSKFKTKFNQRKRTYYANLMDSFAEKAVPLTYDDEDIDWNDFCENRVQDYVKLVTEIVFKHLTYNVPKEYWTGDNLTVLLNGRILDLKTDLNDEITLGDNIIEYIKRETGNHSDDNYKRLEKESVISGLLSFNHRSYRKQPSYIDKAKGVPYPTYHLGFVRENSAGTPEFRKNFSENPIEISSDKRTIKRVRAYTETQGPIEEEFYEQLAEQTVIIDWLTDGGAEIYKKLNLRTYEPTNEANHRNLTMYHNWYHKLVFTMYMKEMRRKGGDAKID
jgi:serine/threonine protein kinase